MERSTLKQYESRHYGFTSQPQRGVVVAGVFTRNAKRHTNMVLAPDRT